MKTLYTLIILLNVACAFAQNNPSANVPHSQGKTAKKDMVANKDSVAQKDTSKNKEPRYCYLAANTNVFVNSKGNFAKRFSPSFEFGRTYGIFDIGIAAGKLNTISLGSDTTNFMEFRPTINIFSKGRFSEALCLGAGYVFNADQGLMTEICNSINFNISEIWTVSVLQGYYYFDGTNSSRGTQYMGLNVTYNFLKKHGVNIKRKKAAILSD